MQIGRIKQIKNIGTFSNFENGASIGFEKMTFIYGLNTYGKTTLSDIFDSYKTNDSSIIEKRKTIPEITTEQRVSMTLSDGENGESDVVYSGGSWSQNCEKPEIDVFGTDFIHKNVFTGLTIERQNKENFTNFILGDQGVQLAEKIKDQKKMLGDKKRELKEKTPKFVRIAVPQEVEKFVQKDISHLNLESINQKIASARVTAQKEEERLKEPNRIINLPEPQNFNCRESNLENNFQKLNELLEKDHSGIKEESILKLNEHVEKNFKIKDSAKDWIQHGLKYCNDTQNGNCPFCGQNLFNAKELVTLYGTYFDRTYTDFIEEINAGLEIHLESIKNTRFNASALVQNILLKIKEYKDLITDDEFKKLLVDIENILNEFGEDDLENEKGRLYALFEKDAEKKRKIPYQKIETINCSNFLESLNKYHKRLSEISTIVEALILKIQSFKKLYKDSATIQQNITKIKNEINELEYQKARVEQNDDCEEYKKIKKIIDDLENGENGITKLEESLKKDQTNFLKEYFDKINELFAKFGSKNFSLGRNEDNKGHMPVYSLTVKFHNQEIQPNQLATIFSESDRRALALAIFFARFELKESDDKIKTILTLDDPVTSFDDNRTTNSINYFKEVIEKSAQIIILTHYIHFIKRFCEITKNKQINTKFINIQQNNITSFLEVGERSGFVCTEYEKVFMKIYDFINKKNNESIKTDLRPFLEEMYLPAVFSKQIQDKQVDCSSLENIIDGLFADNDDVKSKFHEFRNTLNPDSHIFTNNNPEDVRNFAENMFKYLYSFSFTK